jgi:membrane protein DedA with SNARE-associated domain
MTVKLRMISSEKSATFRDHAEGGTTRGFPRWRRGPEPYRALRLWRDLRDRDDGKRRDPDARGNHPGQRCRLCRHQACAGHPLVIAAAAGGAIVGDNIGFWVGREFGEPLLGKWGHLIGLDARKRMLGRYLFARYGGSIVFFGRFVALLRAFAALLAGANGLSPWRFFVFNAAGGIVWATVFGLGGYLLGEGIRRIAGPIGWALLTAALIGAFVLWRYYKRHEESLLARAEREMARQDWR